MDPSEKKLVFSFEEYLHLEEKAEYKSEFFKGEIFAMSGGSRNHSLIGANISRELGSVLLDKDCSVFNSELKVKIANVEAGFYPDGMVICGPEEFYEERKDVVTNPSVIIEVLSDSTGAWDRGGKFRQYQLIPSLKEYILIEQNEAQVDVFRKNSEGFWVLEGYAGLDAKVEFKSLGVSIPGSGIYHRVSFEEKAEASTQTK